MNKSTELIEKFATMISDLQPVQNPAWERPDDSEVINLLREIWVYLEDFEEPQQSVRDMMGDMCDNVNYELNSAMTAIENAISELRDLENKISCFE